MHQIDLALPEYSVIIPVFNRPEEIEELLQSLVDQDFQDFEVIIVEDGSTNTSEHIVANFKKQLKIRYYHKQNTGPGDSRNFGMNKAKGKYFIFFDSDCVVPANYFSKLNSYLSEKPLDAFGGSDSAHESFTSTQKAINYTMTSFLTTGGIRGGTKRLEKFQPRSFNMGISAQVYRKIGGFCDMHPGEDPDLSFRTMDAGFRVGLIPGLNVYHKRRIDFWKFLKQVYKFGMVRVILNKWHPEKRKAVFLLPTLFLLGSSFLLLVSLIESWYWLVPLLLFSALIGISASIQTKSLLIGFKSIIAAFIQLFGYGYGYVKAYCLIFLLKKNERTVLPNLFFKK